LDGWPVRCTADFGGNECSDRLCEVPSATPVGGAQKIDSAAADDRRRQTNNNFILSGERGRNRTYNLLIKSQLLCQLSYAPGPWVTSRWGKRRPPHFTQAESPRPLSIACPRSPRYGCW